MLCSSFSRAAVRGVGGGIISASSSSSDFGRSMEVMASFSRSAATAWRKFKGECRRGLFGRSGLEAFALSSGLSGLSGSLLPGLGGWLPLLCAAMVSGSNLLVCWCNCLGDGIVAASGAARLQTWQPWSRASVARGRARTHVTPQHSRGGAASICPTSFSTRAPPRAPLSTYFITELLS
eukprot:6207293-Pleurochrysis_carterae.AAC.3